jgi:hypothetical protein
MSKSNTPVFYEVKKVGAVEGPVGMDIGIWLHFETDRGNVTLKLFHEDAAILRAKLDREASLGPATEKPAGS